MAFRGIFRHKNTVVNKKNKEYVFDGFSIKVALFSTVFFVSAIVGIYFFGETFITLANLSVKFLFFSLVSLFVSFFYAQYHNKQFYPYITPVSFVIVAPLFLVLFLTINFYFSQSYVILNYRIPEDFRVESADSKVLVLTPVYSEKLIEIPNYQQLKFTKDKIKLSESEMQITINYGCFGYYVVRKIEYI